MIDFQNVYKQFGGQAVLVDASFTINDGERVGIVGPNGAGKSTIFELIAGELSSDKGSVTVAIRGGMGYLHQHLAPASSDETLLEYAESGMPELVKIERQIQALEKKLQTVPAPPRAALLEQVGQLQTQFEDMGGYRIRHRAESSLCGLGFSVDELKRPFDSFSGGWQMRAELARVTSAEPALLLMDEPSNYLDTVAVEWLQRFLRDFAGTLVLISHDRYLLNTLCDVTVEVANRETTRYAGNYDAYVCERQGRREQREAERKKQDRIRKQAERFIERFRAKNTKASQVQSKIKMLERMETVDSVRDIVSPGRIRIPPPVRSGHQVAILEGAGVNYDGEKWVLRGLDLVIERGEKTALVGLNGTGKTTLLRVLAGRMDPSEGSARLGHKVKVGYQSQEFTETLDERLSVFDSVKQVGRDDSDEAVRTLLGGFGFSGDSVEKSVGVLSGGERVRLAFARLLIVAPSFLILDEPTTHLDIPAREALEEGLAEYGGTLCFVSHDIQFVRRVATSIIAMVPPGIQRYPGGYDYYREKTAGSETNPGTGATSTSAAVRRNERRERAEVVQKYSKARRELKKQVERLEKTISALEGEQADLAEQLSQVDAGVDYAGINQRLSEIQQKLADTTRRWEAFAIELEELEMEYAQAREARG